MPQEIQRQRLRHLIASSVLDIWKKETGSVTSVLIEGTVCITGQGGRSTVIQLSDRFAGLIPDAGNALSAADGNDVKVSFSTDICNDAVQMNHSGLLAAVAASRTAGGFEGSARAHKEKASNKDRNNNQAGVVDAESRRSNGAVANKSRSGSLSDDRPESLDYDDDISEIEIDDEESTMNDGSGGQRVVDEHLRPQPPAAHSRPQVARTEAGGGSDFEDSAIQDMSMSFNSRSAVDACGTRPASISADSQKTPLSFGKVRLGENTPGLKSSEASSISPSEVNDPQFDSSDLLLSSPQDLTAQVRNVIRQRLMAHKLLSPYEIMVPNSSAVGVGGGGGQAGSDSVTGSMSFSRPQNSPYYHSKLSPQWSTPMHTSSTIKRDSPDLSAAARQLMVSPFSSSATSIAQHHLISPPHITRPPMQMGLPVPSSPAAAAAAAIQFGASLHNLLGVRAAAAAAVAAGTQSLGAAGHTLDLKNRTSAISSSSLPAAGGSEPASLSGTAADDSPSPVTNDGNSSFSAGSEQKIYRCDYCLKTFLFKSKYHEHLPVHTSARPFQCHLCTRTYKYKYDLRVHLRTHLGIPTKSTVCPFCAGRFATNKLLRQHMRDAHSDDQVTPAQRAQLGAAVVAGGVGNLYNTAPVTAATPDGMDEDDSNSRCESTIDNHVDTAEGSNKDVSSTANGQSEETGLNGKVAYDASPVTIKQSLSPVLASSVDVTS